MKMQYNCIHAVLLHSRREGAAMIPTLAGVHHLKLPVRDLTRSIEWYASRLGYQVVIEFRKHDRRTGVTMMHPDGGPALGLTLDPDRARAAAGFDYFSISVPDKAHLDQLAAHLTALGEEHGGVHFATIGWILPLVHDPDGHEVRFYSVESHTTLDPDAPLIVDDAIATARVREAEWLAAQGSALRRETDPV
jgi:catechol 2,3-dioxygenase-like lactoylglutathione lyase family enzyme